MDVDKTLSEQLLTIQRIISVQMGVLANLDNALYAAVFKCLDDARRQIGNAIEYLQKES